MRILIISEFYDPEPAAGQRVAEAASALAGRGHTVRVLARKHGGSGRTSGRNGVQVKRLWSPGGGGSGLLVKMIAALWFQTWAFLWTLLSREKWDVLLTLSTPPMCHVAGVVVSRLKVVAHVFWCADVHPDSLFAIGVLAAESLSGRVLAGVNRWALRRCDAVIVVGRCMQERLITMGVARERVVHVPMWHRDELASLPDAKIVDALRSELQLNGRFVVMYSGNLGRMHPFATLLDAAERLEPERGFVFLFSGDGPGVEQVRAEAGKRRLKQVLIHSRFPEEILPEALALADVHVITRRDSAAGISVPGKLYGAMAAGKPVIFLGPAPSEVALTIAERRCGFVLADRGCEVLVNLLRQLRADSARVAALGRRSRAAFHQRYCQSYCCAQFAQAIEQVGVRGKQIGARRPRPHLAEDGCSQHANHG